MIRHKDIMIEKQDKKVLKKIHLQIWDENIYSCFFA